MGFGKKDTTKKKIKRVKPKQTIGDDKGRDDLIINSISGIVEGTCAGCCNIEYIREKMSGVKELEKYVKKCAEEKSYISHRGWLYNKFWTIEEINEISNDKILVDDFVNDNPRMDEDLLMKLTALHERENEPIKITWFEMLINKGVLHMTEKQLYQSLERLGRTGKVYEPHIGEFAPTYDSLY